MREGWQSVELGSFMEFKNGLNADKDAYGSGVKFVNVMDIFRSPELHADKITGSVQASPKVASEYSVVHGDILFNRTSETPEDIAFASVYLDAEPITFGGFVIRGRQTRKLLDPEFCKYVFRTDNVRRETVRRCQGAVRANIGQQDLSKVPLKIPPFAEQRKIAAILRTWDEALEKLYALRAAKQRRLDGKVQRFFEAEYAAHNRQMRAKELFETVSERGRSDLPLLAVMQDIGIVRRDELERRVAMPDGDTSTYKVVRPEDFVISLRSFEGGLEYSKITGLVSPAYTVLRPATEIVGDYYRHFFKSRSFIGRLDKLIFGIRDGKQIAFRDFGDMYIPAPPLDEQSAQAKAIGMLEDDLALEDKRFEALVRQKRGLMQKLLTSEWRVEVSDDEEAAA
jgi:type I restriction enzyme S subunit